MSDSTKKRPRKRRTVGKPHRTPKFSDILFSLDNNEEKTAGMLVNKHPTKLSPEQILFSLEYIKSGYCLNPSVKATFGDIAKDWAESKCHTIGEELLKLPKIKSFILEEMDRRCEKLRVTTDWIANKYKAWANVNVTDYLEVYYPEKQGRTNPRPQIRLKTELDELPDEIKSAIKSISISSYGDLKIEFIDQKSALDSLTKLLGLGGENKLVLDTTASINILFDDQDADA